MFSRLSNLFLFITMVSWRFAPWRWSSIWQQIEEDHRQNVHKAVWELKCQGLVYEDEDGRLWAKEKRPMG